MANRVAEVNRAIKQAGGVEKLTRGRGYYYFRGGNALMWREHAVYVYSADDLSVEAWMSEYNRCKATA